MNIFLLDRDLSKSARYHNDSHICKQPIETNQMLATALSFHSDRTITKVNGEPYKPCHQHHPCTKWVAQSRENFIYACELNLELCQENAFRYGRPFRGLSATMEAIDHSDRIPSSPTTDQLFPVAINKDNLMVIYALGIFTPKEYLKLVKGEQVPLELAIRAYRAYYTECKQHLAKWKNRNKPEWF